MADKELNELTAAAALDGTELVHVEQGGNSRRTTTAAVAAVARPYDVPLSYAGGPPAADEVLQGVVVPRQVDFAADFAGSAGYIGVNPTASFVVSVQDDGVEIGTITVSTGGVFTFATAGGTAKTVAAGSRIEFVGPASADATAAYILATLAGVG